LGASAGLSAASGLLDDPAFAETAKGLEDLLLRDFVRNGSLVKHDATAAVDASLLWLALLLGVVAMDDPLFVETARRVDDELEAPGGGIRRCLLLRRRRVVAPDVERMGTRGGGSRRTRDGATRMGGDSGDGGA